MRRPSLALLATAICLSATAAPPDPIHAVDWKNFVYPWPGEPDIPESWSWLTVRATSRVKLVDSRHTFPPGGPASPHLIFKNVSYGDLTGDGHDEAVVDLAYETGGTAFWDYIFVFECREGRVSLLSILRSGIGGRGGLEDIHIARRLVVDFSDPARMKGLCCSAGIVRVTYQLENGKFVQVGPARRGTPRNPIYKEPKSGSSTVSVRVQDSTMTVICRTPDGEIRSLTKPGDYSEPSLSLDGKRVVFLSRPGPGSAFELWLVNTDGSGLRELFHGPIRWNGADAPATAEIRWPQWSADGRSIYFVVDIDQITGALFRLDAGTGAAKLFLPDVVNYEVLPTGRYKGYLIANQRTMEPSEGYADYPYYLFSPSGEKLQRIGDDEADIDAILEEWKSK